MLPLAGWAQGQLDAARKAAPDGVAADAETLLGERACLRNLRVPGLTSAGGGTQMWRCADGWLALNLARDDDRDLLPAWLEAPTLNLADNAGLGHALESAATLPLVLRGREMGLAVAALDEPDPPPAVVHTLRTSCPPPTSPPLVIDLSALWAGPLAGHLLWSAGAKVIKVESIGRPDAMRDGDPVLFTRLNQGKHSVAVDFRSADGRNALTRLLYQADIVIEAARPRALRHMGIDAETFVAQKPGMIWLTITGHGTRGAAEDWIGFGDDCAVAGGLSRERLRATGQAGFVGDAMADPLTGIVAAKVGLEARAAGNGGRFSIAMSGVVATAIAEEKARDLTAFDATMMAHCATEGSSFPAVAPRPLTAAVSALGSDNARWLAC